jgi:hypothetical protein
LEINATELGIMNRSFSKIRHIQEANQRLEKRMLSEIVLGPERLSSPAGQQNKKHSEFFNKYYKLNLPIDGNWLNPEFSKAMERYLKEKNIPIWKCKKGDGYCPDEEDGVITTKDLKSFYSSIKQDIAKLQTGKINTTYDKSYDYKLEGGKYYYSVKGKNKWVEATGNSLESIKTNVKF